MKLALICIGAIVVALAIGFILGAILPGPIDSILSVIVSWCFGWYIVAPIIIKELGL